MKTLRISLGLSVVAASVAAGPRARADMGTVWVDEVTRSSVTIDWSDPRGSHELATVIPLYRVSWAPVEADESDLLEGEIVLVGAASKPHTISGLDPDTYYQFRVEAYATWVDGSGDALNPKYRQVARIRQRTGNNPPGPVLRLGGVTDGSFDVELTNPAAAAFDVVRFAYKVKWNLDGELNSVAKDPLGPPARWVTSNEICGWVDVASASVLAATIPPSTPNSPLRLSKRTSYEIVAYGFNIGDTEGALLGNVQGQTSGGRPFLSLEEAISTDHPGIVERYSKQPRLPDEPVIEIIALSHPEVLDAKTLLMADHRDDLGKDFTALQFFIDRMPGVLGEVAYSQGSDLRQFTDREIPELSAAIALEVGPAVFQRGDASPNGMLDISDPMNILNFLFAKHASTEISCLDAADANDSSEVDLSDSVYMFNFLFGSGPEPPSPHEECGPDPTPDGLDCEFYEDCPE